MGPKMENVVTSFFHIVGTLSQWAERPGYTPRGVNLPRLQDSHKASMPKKSGYISNVCLSVKWTLRERTTLTAIKYLADTSYSIQNITNTSHTRAKN